MEKITSILAKFPTLPLFTKIALIALGGMFLLTVIIRLGTRSHGPGAGRLPLLGRLAFCATFVSALVLAVSGFGGPLMQDASLVGGVARMSGLVLMGHMVFAGLFIAGLTGIAIYSAESCRLGDTPDSPCGPLKKIFFWCVLAAGLVTILAALVGMTPLGGSATVGLLGEAHRWSALALVMALIGHLFSR